MHYYEIENVMGKNCEKVYRAKREKNTEKEKTMLMVSHTLERGGAPIVLLELVPFFLKDYNIIFVSITDGDMRTDYLKCGLDVHIGNSLKLAQCGVDFWDYFDLVFLNTILSCSFLPLFINRKGKVLWWLHEPELLFKNTYGKIIHLGLLSPNIKILSVTEATANCVEKYYGIKSDILHMGLEDKNIDVSEKQDSKIRFFIPAKFQMIKGQDIMAQAIIGLPSEYHEKAEFIFAGAKDNEQPEYFELVNKLSIAFSSVVMLGEISKEEVYQWYKKVDCVIAPSRADATPTTIVEGMMFNKLCVCSTATGISKYMVNGKDGYIFPAGDSNALKDLLVYIIDNYESMNDQKANGRNIYLEHFERGAIEGRLSEFILN